MVEYKGDVVYRDPADNLSKIKFPVFVSESYNPIVHYSLMREGAPPPIYMPDGTNADGVCRSKLTGDFIIDALCTGQRIEFENMEDVEILCQWIDQYLASYKNIDLTRFPDRAAFLKNCEKARAMLRGNIRGHEAWQESIHPRKLSAVDLLSLL